jgi:hypothetical protein
MRVVILTFDGFNEIHSFVALHALNRLSSEGWRRNVGPSPSALIGNCDYQLRMPVDWPTSIKWPSGSRI